MVQNSTSSGRQARRQDKNRGLGGCVFSAMHSLAHCGPMQTVLLSCLEETSGGQQLGDKVCRFRATKCGGGAQCLTLLVMLPDQIHRSGRNTSHFKVDSMEGQCLFGGC